MRLVKGYLIRLEEMSQHPLGSIYPARTVVAQVEDDAGSLFINHLLQCLFKLRGSLVAEDVYLYVGNVAVEHLQGDGRHVNLCTGQLNIEGHLVTALDGKTHLRACGT